MALNRHLRPDPSTTDRLLAGRIGPDDAPPGYRRVADLLGAAGSGLSEPAGPVDGDLVGAMVTAIQAAPVPPVVVGRKPMLRKILAAKTIAVVSVLALSASGAAAATGNLPDAVQDKVAEAAQHVGVNLPEGTTRVTEGCEAAQSATAPRNRGQFLKKVREAGGDLEAAKLSRCGMPLKSKGTPGVDDAGEAPEAPEATEGQPENNGKAGEDHGKAGEDHGKAGEDHGKAGEDHGKAGEDHGKAGEDHGKAGEDHGKAGEDHGKASENPGAEDLPLPVPLPNS